MMLRLRLLVALVGMLLIGAPATAQTFPKFTGLVVDAANVLPPQTEADLTTKLQALQRDTHRQLVVATIPDLQGYPLEDYGYKLGRAWGVGLKDVNNGAILFIAPNEPAGHRGPRIEVGYGLEPVLTDAFSSVVTKQQMTPILKQGDIPRAMEVGTDALIQQLRASPDEAKARTDAAIAAFDKAHRTSGSGSSNGDVTIPFAIVFWLIVLAFIVLSRLRRGKSGRRFRGGIAPVVLWGPGLGGGSGSGWSSGWGSGGGSSSSSDSSWGGSDFSGGGGGSFGGGGASGDW
jgi:uncharacterized protein